MSAFRLARGAMILCIAPLLAGFCDDVTADPHDGGYLGGLCGLATGRYRQRVRVREDQADELEAINGSLRKDLQTTQHETRDLDTAIAASARQLKAQRAAVETLSTEIERLKQRKAASEQELASLQGNVEEMQRELVWIREQAANKENAARKVRESVQMASARRQIEKLIDKTRVGVDKLENKMGDAR